MRTIKLTSLINEVHNKLVILWLERIPQYATLDEVEEQERIMAEEIIDLVLCRAVGMNE